MNDNHFTQIPADISKQMDSTSLALASIMAQLNSTATTKMEVKVMTDKELLIEIAYREMEVERLLIHAERYLRSMEQLNSEMRNKLVLPGQLDVTATTIRGFVNYIHVLTEGGVQK